MLERGNHIVTGMALDALGVALFLVYMILGLSSGASVLASPLLLVPVSAGGGLLLLGSWELATPYLSLALQSHEGAAGERLPPRGRRLVSFVGPSFSEALIILGFLLLVVVIAEGTLDTDLYSSLDHAALIASLALGLLGTATLFGGTFALIRAHPQAVPVR